MYSKPEAPEVPDYYAALGVSPDATPSAIKRAFRILALKHHPDKLAPGETVDAVEFRRVREAYEVLIDSEKREEYELEHPDIHEEWKRYHRDMEDWERRAAAEAEAEAERARNRTKEEERERRRWIWTMGQNEKARRASIEREEQDHYKLFGDYDFRYCRCGGCNNCKERMRIERRHGLQFPTPEEYNEYLQMRAELAERRSREAARKQREEQQREAEERMRKEHEKAERKRKAEDRKRAAKAKMSEQRSSETARRAREEPERLAKMRMANEHVEEQRAKFLAELGDDVVPGRLYTIEIGWKKTKGVAVCIFCESKIMHYSFRCPDGGALACNPCKNDRCKFTAANEEDVDENEGEEKSQEPEELQDACKERLDGCEEKENMRPSDDACEEEESAEEHEVGRK